MMVKKKKSNAKSKTKKKNEVRRLFTALDRLIIAAKHLEKARDEFYS